MSVQDIYHSHAPSPGAPARRAAAVTPNNDADLPVYAKALYLGQGGDLRLILVGAGSGGAVTLKNHAAGYVAVQARRVLAAGTTAADIVALFD